MIRSYFLTAIRNLFKNRLNTSINVIGLAIAFTCCILLFLMVFYEFSFDSFHKNGNGLYQAYYLNHGPKGDGKDESFPYPAAPVLKAEVPGILRSTSYMSAGGGISYQDKEVNKRIILVDNDFFHMFSFAVVAGNTTDPLGSPGQVVLNQTTARALFGKEDPIGKAVKIKVAGQWTALTVSAVLQDAPDNSTISYSVLARIEVMPGYAEDKDSWGWLNHPVYVQLAPGATQETAEAGIRQMVRRRHLEDDADLERRGFRKDANGERSSIRLAPYRTIHFDPELAANKASNKIYLYTLILIAVVVMAIACFNFINLNVARSFTRAKEVGIRKTIGAARGQIFFQLWMESFLLYALALLIAIGAAAGVLKPFNDLFTEKLTLNALLQPAVFAIALGSMVLVSFLAGGYPAWLVARFNTVEVLKGKVSLKRSGLLRSGLITFQFVMTSALICSTIVIYMQFQHLRTASLGFEQESVISIPVRRQENTHRYIEQLRNQLASRPEVQGVTGCSINFGIGEDLSISKTTNGFNYKGKPVSATMLRVDRDFLKVMGMKPLSGRDFDPDVTADTAGKRNPVILTKSMAGQFGVADPTGLSFLTDSSGPVWSVIGVIPDFHLYGMYEETEPIAMELNPKARLGYILVKVRSDNPGAAMDLVRAAYRRIEPDNETAASYLTDNITRWYEKEHKLANVFFSAAAIAILLSCLGLFAIVSLLLNQRRKEIGVRKVLGASIPSITGLLSKEFVRLVLIAFVIATPIAWYFLNQWLHNFIYAIRISWWIFPLAGVVTLTIALVTISLQTVRASLANPVESLRSE